MGAVIVCKYCKGRNFEILIEGKRPKPGPQDLGLNCTRCGRVVLVGASEVRWNATSPPVKRLAAIKKLKDKMKVLEIKRKATFAASEKFQEQIYSTAKKINGLAE